MPTDDTLTTLAGIAVLNVVAAAILMIGVGPPHPNGHGWRHAIAGFSRRTLRRFASAFGCLAGIAEKLAQGFRR